MELCSYRHEQVCFDCSFCPVCEKESELEERLRVLTEELTKEE